MEVYTCDSVSYVICRNLAFLMLDLATNTLWRDDLNHKLITRQQSEFKQLTDGCYV